MSSRVTILMPDLDVRLGHDTGAVQQMMDIARVLDTDGTLPPAFTLLTPQVRGHGEAWLHNQSGLFIIRADHRPVLLVSERCSLCSLVHRDVAHAYLFGSPTDIENQAYVRYVGTQIDFGTAASVEGGA